MQETRLKFVYLPVVLHNFLQRLFDVGKKPHGNGGTGKSHDEAKYF